jgi:hypothetical protein
MKRTISLILIMLITAGCGTTAKFIYPANREHLVKLVETPKYNLKVAVLPFDENRDDTNNMAGAILSFIPLVPFGKYRYERPDAARMFNTINEFQFDVSEDLAKAAVASLNNSGLFKEAYFTYGGDKENADLILTGSIKSTEYRGTIITYCLSVYGAFFWLLGLPVGSSYNELVVSMTLHQKDKEEPVWRHEFHKEASIKQGLYYRFGHDVKGYTTLMEEGMNEAILSMNKELPSIIGGDAVSEDFEYVGTKDDNKYHYPYCILVQNIKSENLVQFKSLKDAVAGAYEPCETCKPPQKENEAA